MKVKILSKPLYEPREVRLILATIRQCPVPSRTFYHWRSRLGISPDKTGLYGKKQVQILIKLVQSLDRGMTIDGFKAINNLGEQNNATDQQQQRQQQERKQAQQPQRPDYAQYAPVWTLKF